MHQYTVEFRIYGKNLDPDAITTELGLQPSTLRNIGDSVGPKHFKHAEWVYDGSESDQPTTWETLEDGLQFLLGRLNNVRDKLAQYRDRYDMVFWCGHFQSSFDGGPTLSPSLLKQLGDFGVSLFVDNYFSSETEDMLDGLASDGLMEALGKQDMKPSD